MSFCSSRFSAIAMVSILVCPILTNAQELGDFARQGMFQPPPPPTVVPQPEFPSFTLLDIEVDNFIRVNAARETYKVTGKNLAVAVIDSGINQFHDDFVGKILPGRNFTQVGAADDTTDDFGHGSNVSGIIAGRHVTEGGKHTGVAYDAKIIPLKVFFVGDDGNATGGKFEWINEALQWVLDNQLQQDCLISVVNLSLGSQGVNLATLPSLDGPDLTQLKRQQNLIRQLRERNIVVTVSAGNDYSNVDPTQGMSFPAIIPETLSVGAIYDVNLPRLADNSPRRTYRNGGKVFFTVAGRCTVFSQRLSAANGGSHCTDIFSPGFFVTSAGPVQRGSDGQIDESLSKSSQTIQDGTSQASPVTAGVVLLLQERYVNLTAGFGASEVRLPPVELVEQCLKNGGHLFADVDDNTTSGMHNVQGSAGQYCYVDSYGALSQLNVFFQNDLANIQSNLLNTNSETEVESVLRDSTILTKPVLRDR